MNLKTKVELVPTSPEYAELWLRWRNEANARRFNPVKTTNLDGLRVRMASMSSDLSKLSATGEYQFFLSAAHALVGVVNIRNVNVEMKHAEIGYSIAEAYQGQGLATEAVRLLVERVFRQTDLRRLIAYVAEENTSSRRVLEKLGFKQEGLFREHFIINDVPTNEVVYAILRSDIAGISLKEPGIDASE